MCDFLLYCIVILCACVFFYKVCVFETVCFFLFYNNIYVMSNECLILVQGSMTGVKSVMILTLLQLSNSLHILPSIELKGRGWRF
jgi:hypothetical protein